MKDLAHSSAEDGASIPGQTGAAAGGSGPGGWLVKDFADGWYWTGNRLSADMAANGGASVFNVATGEYETEAKAEGREPLNTSSERVSETPENEQVGRNHPAALTPDSATPSLQADARAMLADGLTKCASCRKTKPLSVTGGWALCVDCADPDPREKTR